MSRGKAEESHRKADRPEQPARQVPITSPFEKGEGKSAVETAGDAHEAWEKKRSRMKSRALGQCTFAINLKKRARKSQRNLLLVAEEPGDSHRRLQLHRDAAILWGGLGGRGHLGGKGSSMSGGTGNKTESPARAALDTKNP